MTNKQRAELEIAEFTGLYPDTELDSIPVSVWERVKTGVNLTDAYGDYEKMMKKRYEEAGQKNEENAASSSGRINGAPRKSIYTAREVAAMTQREVAKNYNDILYSMESKGFYS